MAAKKTYYVVEEQLVAYEETGLLGQANYQDDPDETSEEPRCSVCNELLAWHEQVCVPPIAAATAQTNGLRAAATTYAYDLGHVVQPVRQAWARTIIWRGQLKERHPQTGLVHRVNVYRLNDDFWDCYHEDELQAA